MWDTDWRFVDIVPLSRSILLPAGLLCGGEASRELIGQCVLPPTPVEVRRLSRLVVLRSVDEERAELDGQSRPDQADPASARALRARVVESPAGGVHVQRLRAERGGQLLCPAAVRQQLPICRDPRRPRGALQQVGEDHGAVIAAHKVPLPATRGQEGEVLLITTTPI